MSSLREQQQRFAEAILSTADALPSIALANGVDLAERIAIYRSNVFSNYRNSLGASYPVVCRLVGRPFFDTAVDAFVRECPSPAGDLNVYGGDFGDFLASYPYAQDLPYLAGVAHLEWAIDEAHRARDHERNPRDVLSALGAIDPDLLPSIRLSLDRSCHLLASAFPVLRIWRVNQTDYAGDAHVDLGEGADRLLVRRDAGVVGIERLDPGTFTWLRSLASGSVLEEAFQAAQQVAPAFDLGAALSAHVGLGTLARIEPPPVR